MGLENQRLKLALHGNGNSLVRVLRGPDRGVVAETLRGVNVHVAMA